MRSKAHTAPTAPLVLNALRYCKSRKNYLAGFDQFAMGLSKRIYDNKVGNGKKYIQRAQRIFTACI
jgi:hypothetical protein